jgi:hypothetical protein
VSTFPEQLNINAELIRNFKLRCTYIKLTLINIPRLQYYMLDVIPSNTLVALFHSVLYKVCTCTISYDVHFRILQSNCSWLQFSKGNISNYNSWRCHVALHSTNVARLMHIRYYSTLKDPTLRVSVAATPTPSHCRHVCTIDSPELRSTKRCLVTSSLYKIQTNVSPPITEEDTRKLRHNAKKSEFPC